MNQKQDYHSEMSGSPISVCVLSLGGYQRNRTRVVFMNKYVKID